MKKHLLIFFPGNTVPYVPAGLAFYIVIVAMFVSAALPHVAVARGNYYKNGAGMTSTINTAGAPSAVNTTYGTASPSSSFSVSGNNMMGGILVTPPAGFEVSVDNSSFSPTVTVGSAGNIPSTTIYIRLMHTAGASSYSGNIVLSSSGASNANVAMPNSTVSPAPLTITANDVTKTYGTTLTGGQSSTGFTASGLQNGETIGSVAIGYGPGSAGTDGVGNYGGCVTAEDPTGGTFNPDNYTISYVGGQIIVNPAPLSIAANNAVKTYGTTLTGGPGSTAFTATGLQNGETIGSVTIAYGPGAAATDGIGTYVGCVTVSQGTGGNFRGSNYTITHPSANIIVNPAPLTITANDVYKAYGLAIQGSSGSTEFTAVGLQNGETITSVTTNYGSGSAATDPVGPYYKCVTAANPVGTFLENNYTVTYVPGNIYVGYGYTTLEVDGNPAALSTEYGTASPPAKLTLKAANMVAGTVITAPPGFIVSSDGENFANSITIPTTGSFGPETIDVELDPTAAVGSYDGYVTFTSQSATEVWVYIPISSVSTATVNVTANNETKIFGQDNPTLTISYEGFKNGQNASALTAEPVIATAADINSPVGDYAITVTGAQAPNYAFHYNDGVLTVYPTGQMIIVPNAFTPNGDGVNDTWDIKYLDVVQNCSVEVFNRYGQKIYYSNGYGTPWNGTYNGAAVPAGTYYYIINMPNGYKMLTGYVAIIR